MNRWLALFLIVFAVSAQTAEGQEPDPQAGTPCSDAWYRSIEGKVATGDGQGHGPDIGSDEWKSVVEFKLGIRGEPDLPGRGSEAWCRHIDRLVSAGHASSQGDGDAGETVGARGPSYDCNKTEAGSIEALICEDAELSLLDRKLAGVYTAASGKAGNEYPPVIRAEQRGWIKGRNECWKSDNTRDCVREEYLRRIAELQARYRLVADNGPVRFVCDGNPANEVVATFFKTDLPTLIAERGDSVSLMYLQPGGSGTQYQGRNETFREHQDEAIITWGYGAQEMRCRKAQGYSGPE
jgi:uncharacterized protein